MDRAADSDPSSIPLGAKKENKFHAMTQLKLNTTYSSNLPLLKKIIVTIFFVLDVVLCSNLIFTLSRSHLPYK